MSALIAAVVLEKANASVVNCFPAGVFNFGPKKAMSFWANTFMKDGETAGVTAAVLTGAAAVIVAAWTIAVEGIVGNT